MGHLERSPGMDLEREADSFAARVMLCTAENPCVATWRALGTSILFSALEIIEKIRGQSATTHPEAAADLAEVLTMIRLLWKEGFNELKKHRKREC